MSDWDLSGLDELVTMCDELEISDAKERKALNIGGEILLKSAIENAPELTGYNKKSIKKKITKSADGDKACEISVNAWDAKFIDWGTSKSKKYVNWFENAIDDKIEEAIKSLEEVILK